MATDEMREAVRFERDEQGVCVVTFDRPGSSANVFDSGTLNRLEEILDGIAADPGVRAVVFRSAKPAIFVAGADVHELQRVRSEEELAAIVERGQRVFAKVAQLRARTVAAIHGACLGGGCELALACDVRVASDSSKTKIGLPEVMLGIIPAWGGSTRLPRLIGLPAALDMILGGKRLSAKQARRRGLVDEVAPKELLLDVARRWAAKPLPKRKSYTLTNNFVAARLIGRKARAAVLRKTRGHYPAPLAAIDVVTRGVARSVERSLELERAAVLELARTEACRNQMSLFLLQERAKHLAPSDALPGGGDTGLDAIPHGVGATAVVGAGVMGSGIAQWLSARGHRVILRDIDDRALLRGMRNIARVYEQAVKRHVFDRITARDGLYRITPTAKEVPLRGVDLVIEAAVEDLELKRRIFARLEQLARPDTILATNTSALPITEIASGLEHPERVVGLHFFNPVHRMQLVEIVLGRETSPEVAARALRFVQSIGKLPIVVTDSPGFAVNRILMPYLLEAGHLFAGGASITAIDEAMLDFGMPMGPLRLLDEVGIDVAGHVGDHVGRCFGERMPVPELLGRMIEAGMIGRKAGQGFYVYEGKGRPRPNPAAAELASTGRGAGLTTAEMQERMVLLMLNEAARCIEEGIVAAPEDVDLGMVMGTGFAPFRGGPLRYLDALGAAEVVRRLERWAGDEPERFAPCELLRRMAQDGGRFYAS
ncbi:MAG: fatty acid oxidation complex subunit alpha FadJ [Acidobacteria bacterium]|nr:MAG: fatty acid oxidation complex subunit alpha FadJ [Acidobacteriota bacterium]